MAFSSKLPSCLAILRGRIVYFIALIGIYLVLNLYKYYPSIFGKASTQYSLAIDQLPPWTSIKFVKDFLQETIETENKKEKLSPPLACKLPLLQPFSPEIIHLLSETMPPLHCETDQFPLIFNSDLEPFPRIYPVKEVGKIRAFHEITTCCIRRVVGFVDGFANGKVDYGKECLPLSLEQETKVPLDWEFLVIECEFLWIPQETGEFFGVGGRTKKRIDVHSFTRPEKQQSNTQATENQTFIPNVILFAIDSTSRLSFRRTFPEIHDFLMRNLSAVEFKGYHKIGANTFPNIGPLLTNKQVIYSGNLVAHDMKLGCEGPNLTFDSCPFIWKDYSKAGYKTIYALDNWLRDQFYLGNGGFLKQPTDYFPKPFITAATESIGHGTFGNISFTGLCFGPRPAFSVLMDYLKKVVIKMEKEKTPYFLFSMTDSLTHDFVNGGREIVKDLLATLKYFHINGYFNNSVLIILSDHGLRLEEMRYHYQGYLEERLPPLYFALPTWFKTKYPEAFNNMKTNADERLVVPFDVYETLVDLLPQNIGKLGQNSQESKGPGISLFTLVPTSRTCETAGIIKDFCACNLKLNRVSAQNPMLIQAAQQIVGNINNLLVNKGMKKCASLTLNTTLISAESVLNSGTNVTEFYRIVFETFPGKGSFEAMLSFNAKNIIGYERNVNSTQWKAGQFSGNLERINMYKTDSWCINDKQIKPFCYCKS